MSKKHGEDSEQFVNTGTQLTKETNSIRIFESLATFQCNYRHCIRKLRYFQVNVDSLFLNNLQIFSCAVTKFIRRIPKSKQANALNTEQQCLMIGKIHCL